MRGFSLLLIIGILTLAASLPTKTKYRVYKNSRSKDTVDAGSATVPVQVQTVADAAAVPSRAEPKPTVPAVTVPSPVPDEEVTLAPTEKPKTGNTPVGEPTKAPIPAPAFPPAPIKEEGDVPTVAAAAVPPVAPSPVTPTSAAPSVPSVTVVPTDPPKKTNSTTSEEDDSSSEEGDEDEEDDDGRKIVSRRKSKSVKFGQLTSRSNSLTKGVNPKNPPLKYDLVINGFVTEDGQVLVPFDTYQKYFHDEQNKYLPPVYAITRDDTHGPSASAVVSEETDVEKSSEEVPLVKNEKSKESQADTDSAESPIAGGVSSEEISATGIIAGESDEKDITSSEIVATAPVSNAVHSQPLVPSKQFFRPPLQALPARLPTNEDDEEDAGRRRHLAHLGYVSGFDYDDDYEFDDDEPNPYFGL